MKERANTISKKMAQSIAYTAFALLIPRVFAAQELILSAPRETLAPPADTMAPKKLLTLPSPHRDLSVYDEGPLNPQKSVGVADSLVISPVPKTLPAPSDGSSPGQTSVMITPKPKKKAALAAPTPNDNLVDKEDDTATTSSSSPFSLQHAAGLKDDSRIHINGFLTAGGVATNNGAYYVMPGYGLVRNEFNFGAVSRIGLQVTGDIMQNVAVVGQFVANGDNTYGRQPYNVTADWAYLRYTPRPEIQLRAGRFRLPTLFYSENAEVGYTYPWIILPNEVYGPDPITNLNGVSSISSLSLGQSNWTFKMQPFFGESSYRAAYYNFFNTDFIPGTVVNFSQDDVYGSALSLGNPYFEVRGSYMSFNTTVTSPLAVPVCPNGLRLTACTLINKANSKFYSLGAKLNIDHFLVVGEYAHRNIAAIISAINSYYIMAAYQFSSFLPNITYAHATTTNRPNLFLFNGEFPTNQDSVTLGLNYTINNNLLAKVSLSAIQPLNGTFGFFANNPGRKTIMMYGVSLDAIF